MSNIFNNCKTLGDLYEVFAYNPDLTFEITTDAELNRLADVFEANVAPADMVDTPLGETEFNHIRNFVITKVNGVIEDIQEETTNPTETNNKEEKIMGTVKGNVNAAVEEMMNKFAKAKENIKVNAGETKDEYIERVDDSLNVMKSAFGDVLNTLDTVLGYGLLKESVLDMMEASTDGKTSKKDLFKMAKRCRELIEDEIDNLLYWADEESLKKAIQLKALTENERGKSVFESFVVGVIWIAKKVARKLHQWFKVDEEKSIIGSICRSIAGFANVLRAGVRIVWNAAKFAVSFIVSGIVIIADFIVRAVKSVVTRIKEWNNAKDEEAEIEDEEEIIVDEAELV